MLQCYSLKDAAKALKISVDTLYNLHRDGKISFLKIGSRNRITSEELERFLKAAAETHPQKTETEDETR